MQLQSLIVVVECSWAVIWQEHSNGCQIVFQLYIRHIVRYCDPLYVQLNHMKCFNIIMWAVLCILCILCPTFDSCIATCLRHMMTQHLTNRRLSPGILQNDPKTQNKQFFFRFPAPARAFSLHFCWFFHHYRANA